MRAYLARGVTESGHRFELASGGEAIIRLLAFISYAFYCDVNKS